MRDLSEYKTKLKEILDNSKNILVTMSAPDGDSVGSALTLKSILEQNDKNVDIVCSFDLSGRFNNYSGSSSIIISDLGHVDFSRYDSCFTVDAGQLARLVRSELYTDPFKFPSKLPVINIDHHESNDLFGTLNINITDASCTSEIIDTLFDGEYVMDSYLATLMYFSVVFDTGNFRFSITKHLFEFAQKCIEKDANTELVIDEYFNKKSLSETKYQAVLIQRISQENNYAYTFAYHDDMEKNGIDVSKYLSATATVARDFICAFHNTEFGWILSERKNNVVKLEMRARNDNTPILEITKSLGGGGHKRACGAKILDKTIEEVQDYIIKYLS